jgi:hypothetical protein
MLRDGENNTASLIYEGLAGLGWDFGSEAVSAGVFYGSGQYLTGLDGENISAGTVTSNAIDAGTWLLATNLNGSSIMPGTIRCAAFATTNAPQAGYFLRVDATGTNLYYSPN